MYPQRFQAGESFPCGCLSKMVYIRNSSVGCISIKDTWTVKSRPPLLARCIMHTDMTGQRVKVVWDGDIIILREFLKKCITDCIVVSLLGWHRHWWDRRDKRNSYIVIAISQLMRVIEHCAAQTRCKVFANARFPI